MSEHSEPRGLTDESRAKMTRRLCAVVLMFEGLVVFFGSLVASRMSDDVSSGTALAVGGGLAIACILATGLLRSPSGIPVGWGVQVLVLATGVVVPAMRRPSSSSSRTASAVAWWVRSCPASRPRASRSTR